MSEKIVSQELLIKISLVIILFMGTFLVFKMLQKPKIYNSTLSKISHNYSRDVVNKNIVWKVKEPYYYRDTHNTCRWDGSIYNEIRENYYNNGDHKYAFFPLFPLLWKISHISVLYIGLINYLLFGISVIIFSMFFLDTARTGILERICVFTAAIVLPQVVVYYLPYAEALFTFTFALAIYGLIKNKYWLFFIAILLFAMTRPTFLIIGLSFVIIDVVYLIKHRNIGHFIKELSLKLLPLLLGTCIVFIMYYFNSGSLTKYFESVNQFWSMSFRIPDRIADWSIEGFGMNVFTIFFIVITSLILFLNNFLKIIRSDKTEGQPSIFKGDTNFIKEYFFNNAIIYFWGVFIFVVFYQDCTLNGLSRYIIASPYFFIFLFYFYANLKEIKLNKLIIGSVVLTAAGLFMLTSQFKLEPKLNFSDSGFFLLLFTFLYLSSLRYMNTVFKIACLLILVLLNVIWITYLYNIYLCNACIFT